jgi:hypothetical protein
MVRMVDLVRNFSGRHRAAVPSGTNCGEIDAGANQANAAASGGAAGGGADDIFDLVEQEVGQVLRVVEAGSPWAVSRLAQVAARLTEAMLTQKQDGTPTEDHFSVRQGQPIGPLYGRSLGRQWPEYLGTHKEKVDFTQVAAEIAPTITNTFTFVIPAGEASDFTAIP